MSKLDIRTRTTADVTLGVRPSFSSPNCPVCWRIGPRSSSMLSSLGRRKPSRSARRVADGLSRPEEGVSIVPGDSGTTQIRLNDGEFSDYLNDLTTIEMLFKLNHVSLERGDRIPWAFGRSSCDL